MSHHIYHTEGLVIASANKGEADKLISLFTSDFGYIKATAIGVRELKSKLRYSLEHYSKSDLSLIQTKTGWRITNARLETNYFREMGLNPKFRAVARIFSLIKRLLQGEEKNTELYESISSGFAVLKECRDEDVSDVEAVIVLRILHKLGYVDGGSFLGKFVSDSWDKELIAEVFTNRRVIISAINSSLQESHL